MISQYLNLRGTFKLLLALLLAALTACGSVPPRQPFALEQAKKAEQAAHRALHDGDLKRAQELFRQSMLIQQSLDNLAASAMAAINLSSVSHSLAEDAAALELLDHVLTESTAQIPSELRAVAAFRKGIILADAGKSAEAESALQLAILTCNRECAYISGMNNLRARLALSRGDYEAALSTAISVIKSGAEKEELANALRIAAAAEAAQGRTEEALAHYQAALELDKALALSTRIAEDLAGIGKAFEKLGNKSEADAFAHRAAAVKAASRMLHGNAAIKFAP